MSVTIIFNPSVNGSAVGAVFFSANRKKIWILGNREDGGDSVYNPAGDFMISHVHSKKIWIILFGEKAKNFPLFLWKSQQLGQVLNPVVKEGKGD